MKREATMMASKRSKATHRVTIDGETYTRTSYHDYTHVVAGRFAGNGVDAAHESAGPLQWSKSRENAEKGARTFRGYGCYAEVRVVEVDPAR